MAADGAAAGTSAYTSSIVKGSAGIGSGTVKQEDGCQRSGTPSPTTGELTLPSEPSSRAGDSSATPAMTATTVQQVRTCLMMTFPDLSMSSAMA